MSSFVWGMKSAIIWGSLPLVKSHVLDMHSAAFSPMMFPATSTRGSARLQLTRQSINDKMPSTAILHYFDDPGRAEATRVALAYAGKDFQDNIMGFPEYDACKWAGKGLPVLEMDGAEYTQSTALLRYAGKLGGLYPDDALAALKVDEIVMIGEDVMANMFTCFGQKDDTVAKAVLDGKVSVVEGVTVKASVPRWQPRMTFLVESIKTLVDMLVAKLAANPSSKFFVGSSPTIADLQVHALIKNFEANFLTGIPTTHIADTAPTLMEMQAALLEDPKTPPRLPLGKGEGLLRFQGINTHRIEDRSHPLATVGMAEDI
ncbi:unnamed protein product [Ectocarpus fasciculatus]